MNEILNKNNTVPVRSERVLSPASLALGSKVPSPLKVQYNGDSCTVNFMATTPMYPLSGKPPNKKTGKKIFSFNQSYYNNVQGKNTSLGVTVTRMSYLLDRLAFAHATLGESVGIVSA